MLPSFAPPGHRTRPHFLLSIEEFQLLLAGCKDPELRTVSGVYGLRRST